MSARAETDGAVAATTAEMASAAGVAASTAVLR
jgi:hypothetical protein